MEVSLRGRKRRGYIQSVRQNGTIYVVRINDGSADNGQTVEQRPDQVTFLD